MAKKEAAKKKNRAGKPKPPKGYVYRDDFLIQMGSLMGSSQADFEAVGDKLKAQIPTLRNMSTEEATKTIKEILEKDSEKSIANLRRRIRQAYTNMGLTITPEEEKQIFGGK